MATEAPPNGYSQSRDFSLLGEDVTLLPIFWVGETGSPVLVASRCPSCGDLRFPPQELCPIDNETAMCARLGGRGRIYEVVRVALGPPGFPTPYWVGYVDLDEGIRIFGRIETERAGSRDPAHGDVVVLEFTELSAQAGNEKRVLAPVFRQQL